MLTYTQKLEYIEARLPLEVPLYSTHGQIFKNSKQHYMIRKKTAILLKGVGYAWCKWGFYTFKTKCGLEFYIPHPDDGSGDMFTQCIDRADPNDFEIPLETVYQIAQGVPPLLWLFKAKSFWNHLYCERQLIPVIHGFLTPTENTKSSPQHTKHV
jgi:hypothetical protein